MLLPYHCLQWLTLVLILPLSNASNFTFRPMTTDDIDAVADTFVSAFDPGPLWTYLYQFRDLYPAYHWRCNRDNLETEWSKDPAGGITRFVNVIVPAEEESTDTARSIGWWNLKHREERAKDAGWSMPFSAHGLNMLGDFDSTAPRKALQDVLLREKANDDLRATSNQVPGASSDNLQAALPKPDLPCNLHLDMNVLRAAHLSPQLIAVDKTYIEDSAYEYQLYLALLATHPAWDGHNFGAAQVHWGMARARAEEKRLSKLEGRKVRVPITLLATPAGYPLYSSLGFEGLANVTLRFLEGGETWYEYMRWFSED